VRFTGLTCSRVGQHSAQPGVLQLRGQALPGGVRAGSALWLAGDTVRLKLYWQPLRKMDQDYTVFTHILGAKSIFGDRRTAFRKAVQRLLELATGNIVEDEYTLDINPIPTGPV